MMAEARRGQWTDQQLAAKAVELAESILKQSNAGMRGKEKRQAQQMERMMNDPAGKAFTLALADRVQRLYIYMYWNKPGKRLSYRMIVFLSGR